MLPHSLDETRTLSIIANYLSNVLDLLGQRTVGYKRCFESLEYPVFNHARDVRSGKSKRRMPLVQSPSLTRLKHAEIVVPAEYRRNVDV
jgi:hypothetical protein